MLLEKKVKISNKTGLHARPASKFIQQAAKFHSDIKIILGDKEVNAKSIIALLSLGAAPGSEITLQAEGSDAEAAINDLVNFIKNVLPEEERE